MGDAIMALFPTQANDAIQAAIAMQQEVTAYNLHRLDDGYQPISIGIGLHLGMVMLGTIGEVERMEGTVISDAVNLAAKLEKHTKAENVRALVDAPTYRTGLAQGYRPSAEPEQRLARPVEGTDTPMDLVVLAA